MRDRNQNKQAAKEAQDEKKHIASEAGKEKEEEKPKEPSDFSKRTKYTLIMLGGFLLIIAMGHFYITILILGLAAGTPFSSQLATKKRLLL